MEEVKNIEEKLQSLLESYPKDPTKYGERVKIEIDNYKNTTKDKSLPEYWKEFIIRMVGLSYENDYDLCRYLVDFAQELDDKLSRLDMKYSVLYDAIVNVHPEAVEIDDLKKYYKKNVSGADSFGRFCNRAISLISKTGNARYASKILDWLIKEGDVEHVAKYLEKLLDSNYISENVLNKEFFANRNRAGERFAHKVEKFIKKNKESINSNNNISLIYDDTLVWRNVEDAYGEWKRRRKKRILIITLSVLAVIAVASAAFGGFSVWWNSINKSTIEIEGSGIINCIYGESPELDGYSITYRNHSGEEVTIPVTTDMIDYDAETIGKQTATITYNGKSRTVTVEISAAALEAPVISQSGTAITWRSVEHASAYNIYVALSQTAAADKEYDTTTATSYDFSSTGLSGSFYVYVVATSDSEKYGNSENSERLALTKLANVSTDSITYTDGCIVWEAVEGADHYMLTYNGNSQTNLTATSYEVEFSGDIVISINAYSSDSNVIYSTGAEVTLHKLAAVATASYEETDSYSRITWKAEEECNYIYSLDGEGYGKVQSENYIDVSNLDGIHSISIICYPVSTSQVQSDEVTYNFLINGGISVSSEGVVSWTAAGKTYDVYIDGALSRSKYTVTSVDLSNDNLSAGKHTVSVVANGVNGVDGEVYGKTLTFTQLAAPELSVSNGTSLAVTNDTSYTVYTCNGAIYTDLSKLTEIVNSASGDYAITVKNLSTDENVISSATTSITVTKLAVPVLSVSSGEIVSSVSGGTLQFYKDGSRTTLDGLSAGTHTLTAKFLGSGANQLDSGLSDPITVTKLSAPVLEYDSTTATITVTTTSEYNIRYYVDGEAYNDNVANLINSLSAGSHSITARYIGNDVDIISSSESNTVTHLQTDTKMSVSDNGDGYAVITLSNMEEGLKYELIVTFYDENGDVIDTLIRYDQTDSVQRVKCVRGKGNAYRIMVVITFTSGDATYTLSGSTDISWN